MINRGQSWMSETFLDGSNFAEKSSISKRSDAAQSFEYARKMSLIVEAGGCTDIGNRHVRRSELRRTELHPYHSQIFTDGLTVVFPKCSIEIDRMDAGFNRQCLNAQLFCKARM